MKDFWLVRKMIIPFVFLVLVGCSNPPADVKAAGEPGSKEQVPELDPGQSGKPTTPDGKEIVPGRIFCVRGQVKSSLATFSTDAAADVFATSLVFKKNEFPLIDLNDFVFLDKTEEQINFAILGEETNPSETSDIAKKQSANIISSRLLNRSSEILETIPVVEHPAAMVGTLESKGYRLNRFLLDRKNSLRVYGQTKDLWSVEVGGNPQLVLSSQEYFSPVVFGKNLYFYKIEMGQVSVVRIDLESPTQVHPLSIAKHLGSVLSIASMNDGLMVLQNNNGQFALNIIDQDENSQLVKAWTSSGRVWLNTESEQVFLVIENEEGKPGYFLSKWADNTLISLGQLLINGDVKDILSFGQEHFALLKNSGVTRIYKVAVAKAQKVISRSECERAWIVKW